MRLDLKLSQLSGISRSQCRKIIDEGLVFVNGVLETKPSVEIGEGDDLKYTIPPEKPMNLEAINIPINIVFEDEHLAVIDKQAGISTHPGKGEARQTLVNGLLYHFQNLSDINNEEGVVRPGIVHRLDKNTSGLMIIAKTNKAHELLSAMIATREVERIYTCLCYGKPKQYEGTIETNIRRNKNNRIKMEVCGDGDGKHAITHYNIERVFLQNSLSLVKCKLQTGRTHQIRVHLTHIGNSIVGDDTYGVKTPRDIDIKFKRHPHIATAIKNLTRHLLHSTTLSFAHPLTNQPLSFTSQCEEMDGLIEILV